MTAIPLTDLEGEGREKRLIRVLYSIRPKGMDTADLMVAMGIEFTEKPGIILPHTAFVEFINAVLRARKLLEHKVFWLMQTGGTPSDRYWIEPHGSIS